MDTTKTILIVLAIGVLMFAGALTFNLLSSPTYENGQPVPSGAVVQQASDTTQLRIQIIPKEVQK